MRKFLKSILSSEGTSSSKRFITLIIALHFIISSFTVLFIAFYVVFYLPKGRLEPVLISLLKDILEYDMWIILTGLGFITGEHLGTIVLERTKAMVAGNISTGMPSGGTVNVENVTVEKPKKENENVDTHNSIKDEPK